MAQVPCDVLLLERARVEGIEVVDRRDPPAVGEQPVDEVTADESRSAGYERVAHDFDSTSR